MKSEVASAGALFAAVLLAFAMPVLALQDANSDEAVPMPYDPAGSEYSITLTAGWNLISVPVADYDQIFCVKAPCYDLMPSTLVESTCASPSVYAFDQSANSYRRIELSSTSNAPSLYEGFEAGKAYWVRVRSACKLTFSGSTRMTPYLLSKGDGWSLSPGWNAVGAPASSVLYSQVSQSCESKSAPLGYNTASGKWERALVLKPGTGYFVRASSSCTLGPSAQVSTQDTPGMPTIGTAGGPQLTLCESTGGNWVEACTGSQACPSYSAREDYCACPATTRWDDSRGCVRSSVSSEADYPNSASASSTRVVAFADLLGAPSRYSGTKLCTVAYLGLRREFSALMASEPNLDVTVASNVLARLEFGGPFVWLESQAVTGLNKPVYGYGGESYQRVRACGLFEYDADGGFGHLGQYRYRLS